MAAGGPPPDDDDPAAEWRPHDTVADDEPTILVELDADATTPRVNLHPLAAELLPGYELGRRAEQLAFFNAWESLLKTLGDRRAAEVLLVLRDEVEAQTRDRAFADEFMRRIGIRAGVRFC